MNTYSQFKPTIDTLKCICAYKVYKSTDATWYKQQVKPHSAPAPTKAVILSNKPLQEGKYMFIYLPEHSVIQNRTKTMCTDSCLCYEQKCSPNEKMFLNSASTLLINLFV